MSSKKTYSHVFDSFDGFFEAALEDNVKQGQPLDERASRRKKEPDSNFNQCATYEEAKSLFTYGWEGGRKGIFEAFEGLKAVTSDMVITQSFEHAVYGSIPDIGRYVAGEPEDMINFCEQPEKPVYRIEVCFSYNCMIHTQAAVNRGAAILALVDLIERAGYSTEINAVSEAEGKSGIYKLIFPAKKGGEPLDMDRLAFILANPDMLRRIDFNFRENQSINERICTNVEGGGYGHALYTPDKEAKICFEEIETNSFENLNYLKDYFLKKVRETGLFEGV